MTASDTPGVGGFDTRRVTVAAFRVLHSAIDGVQELIEENRRLKAGLAPAGWRSMNSAPRDGTPFLVWSEHGKPARVMMARAKPSGWVTVPGDWSIHPKFWQPLPPPPESP